MDRSRRLTLAVAFATSMAAFAAPRPDAQEPAKPAPAAPAPEFKDLPSLLKSLPSPAAPSLTPSAALLYSAVPLGCLDELQPRPTARTYFWEATYKTVDNYDKTRAFYGCGDWHTAVGATYTVVRLLKLFPDIAVNGLVREKLNDHLGRQNFEGELAYFKEAGAFERPYGYAWLLRLQAELGTWKDPEAARWSDNVAPLAKYFADSLIAYLIDLDRANKTATQANTAFALGLLLDYVDITHDTAIQRASDATARRFFLADKDCATDTEAKTAEMISPCLSEAAVMARVLDQPAFVAWLDTFLPAAYSAKFKPLTAISFDVPAAGGRRGGRGQRGTAPPSEGAAAQAPPPPQTTGAGGERGRGEVPQTIEGQQAAAGGGGAGGGRGGPPANPRATMIGLAWTRADAFNRIASALPPDDGRVPVYRRLGAIHAARGAEGMSDPVALDAAWLGTYAVAYLAPPPVEKVADKAGERR
jgi:DUF2891 family protein